MTSQCRSDSGYADTLSGRLGEDKSTRSQICLPIQNDEERLFPGNTMRSDPGAVRIVPGSVGQKSSRKKKLNIGGLRPFNTLSGRARESGPVRARGKAARYSGNQRSTGSNIAYPENGTVHEDQGRPFKRRRRESQDTHRGVISISDDDIMEQIPPDNSSIAEYSTRLSPPLSQHSEKMKLRDRNSKRNRVDEYREVEKGIKPPRTPNRGSNKCPQWYPDTDFEERFTENAAKERRAQASRVDPESTKMVWLDRAAKHKIVASVEIPSYAQKEQLASPTFRAQSIALDQRHPDDSRDSPDELQGDATVQPAPMSLRKDRQNETTIAVPEVKERPGAIGGLSSPSDIQHTVFTGSSQGHRKSGKPRTAQTNRGTSAVKDFYTTFVRFGQSERRSDDVFDIRVETTEPIIIFPWNGERISLQRLDKVLQGDRPSCKVRLKFSRKGGLDDGMDMEFSTPEEQETFCNLLQGLMRGQHVSLHNKSDDWLTKAFIRKGEDLGKSNESMRREDNRKPISTRALDVPKRVKLSDALQDDYRNTTGQMQQPGDTASIERFNPPTTSRTIESPNAEGTSDIPASPKQQGSVEIPVKTFNPKSMYPNRATRSMSRRAPATVVCVDGVEDENPQPKPEETGKKPLVYPRFGKKKAEVNAQDRERLRDNEFLNDNLIGFYMRFLEDHLERTNQEVAKRVYFFNSYFFATLTNTKGRRNINYESVQKWTRAVDIFGFDYIVVPINESAHWYVAIICNLPNLPGIANKSVEGQQPLEYDKDSSAAPDSEAQENPETPEPIEEIPAGKEVKVSHSRDSEPEKDEATRQSFGAMSLSDKEEPKDFESELPLTEWPEQEENLTFSPAKFSSPAAKAESSQQIGLRDTPGLAASPRKTSKKKGAPGGTKFDARQTIIITFDSLDLARSPTISNLRDYLYEEAKSKRGIKIDIPLIKGMRARAIPLQRNFSDCGLYLLAYVEKFVQDPDLFVKKLLRREMKTEDDWPPLKSGLLRRRLRDFLDNLYDEQAQLGSEKASEKKTMADRKPMSYLLGASASEIAKDTEGDDAQKSQVKNTPDVEINSQKSSPRKQRPATRQLSPETNTADQDQELKMRGSAQQATASPKNPSSARLDSNVPNLSKEPNESLIEVQVPDSQGEVCSASTKPPNEQDKSPPSSQAAIEPMGKKDLVRAVEVRITQSPLRGNIHNQRSSKEKSK
ncbi:hypothetical protein BDV28DRAFT_24081 [Aspergillus coremiiformis]|uniref:Ubiquitin-like protease family profile domain-containing protein n=1 Tax=Aspergillus coremiiformis TaxID=138285 RepID=A0A5N6ZFS7_9EURO|nr:hypothetical protein BDV28DRAFT_24081 [Aspergillus coremiiformis]